MKNGIFFLTYDGYYNFTSGIGTQTKTFLKGLEAYYGEYSKRYGEFEVNLIIPNFDESVYGYDERRILDASKIVDGLGGNVYKCASSLDKEGSNFWTVHNWEKVSASAAAIIVKESRKYEKVIVLAIDPPFLKTPRYINIYKPKTKIQSVILMYTSAYIHDEKLSSGRLKWEIDGLASAQEYENIKIGDVCGYMRNHFVEFYGVSKNLFVPYSSSLFLEDTDFQDVSRADLMAVLNKYNIPLNKDIVFAFGRTSWVKGFDTLLKGFSLLDQEKIHLVLLATQFVEGDASEYSRLIEKEKISCSLITDFTRELPVALCQYGRCKIVVCPSRQEPFSNIPLEVALWAKEHGPVVLASNIGGFKEQIIDNKNGFLFNVDDEKDLARKINYILQIPESKLGSIRLAAYKKVLKERDFFNNFGRLLDVLWR